MRKLGLPFVTAAGAMLLWMACGSSPPPTTGDDAAATEGGLDAGPPDLSCLADAGLTNAEQQLIQLPADTWLSIPNTAFHPFCKAHELPANAASSGCDAVITAWSGGLFDDAEREMILWGGGHDDYWGNEVYAFDIATMAWKIVKPATPVTSGQLSVDPLYNGDPDSRHTYGGLAYMSDARTMFAFGGARASNGFSLDTTWFFDPATTKWTQRANAASDVEGHYYMATAYDSATQTIYVRDDAGIFSYDPVGDAWKKLVDYGFAPYYPQYTTSNYRSAVVVPSPHLFVAMGGTLSDKTSPDIVAFDIDSQADVSSTFTTTGDTSVAASSGVGSAYSSAADAIVAWSGGAPAILDVASRSWTRGSSSGAPANQNVNGTYGRFRYIAYLNVFILVNAPADDVFFYKLTPGCGK